MGYDVCLTEEDRDRLVSDYSPEILEQLEHKASNKDEQLDWIDDINKLSSRFHNFFGSKGQHIAEMDFTCNSQKYIAVFLVLEDDKKLAFCGVVSKGHDNYLGSDQDKIIRALQSSPNEVRDKLKSKLETQTLIAL